MLRRPGLLVLLVLLLAPVTAEYLIGYDDIIGDPATLAFGVLIFAPLYGAPAVLIREVCRRRGLGWGPILVLAVAFGLVQAGLVDQSLFDPSYRDIDYWPSLRDPTYLPWFGTSAFMLLTFVSGHVLGSIAAPIALAESWADEPTRPWLRTRGLVVLAVLWALGAAAVLDDQLSHTEFRISWPQGVGTTLVATALVAVALAGPRRGPQRDERADDGTRRAPGPWVVLVVVLALLLVRSFVLTGWTSTILGLASVLAAVWLLGRWSRRPGWTGTHAVAAVTGDLLAIGLPSFWTEPLGDVPLPAKLATNVVLLAVVLAVAARGATVQHQTSSRTGSG